MIQDICNIIVTHAHGIFNTTKYEATIMPTH